MVISIDFFHHYSFLYSFWIQQSRKISISVAAFSITFLSLEESASNPDRQNEQILFIIIICSISSWSKISIHFYKVHTTQSMKNLNLPRLLPRSPEHLFLRRLPLLASTTIKIFPVPRLSICQIDQLHFAFKFISMAFQILRDYWNCRH